METETAQRFDELVERGRACFEAGNRAEALEHFRAARSIDPANAGCNSYYGLCLATVEGRFNQAIDLCSAAVKLEFFNPDLYLNLARVHLAFGFKAEGLRFLRRGFMIDPGHQVIRDELQQLGRRSPPPLGFLPRQHLVNRWLGMAKHLLARAA